MLGFVDGDVTGAVTGNVAGVVTFQQAIVYFASSENCAREMAALRWPEGVVTCPRCGSCRVVYLENARVWKCYGKHGRPKFSLKTGTVFEDSSVGLDKWLAALWLVVNCKGGINSCELGRALGVTQKTAWFMHHRLRFALNLGAFEAMSGAAERKLVAVNKAGS